MKRKILLVALIIVFVTSLALAACEHNYTATFETNGGSAVEALTTNELTSAPATAKEGYIFLGWYDNAELNGASITYPYKLTADTTFYAKWQQNQTEAPKYVVSYNPNGGTPSFIAGESCSQVLQAPQVTREGYELDGWYDNAEFSGSPVTFPYTLTKDTVLHAKWVEKEAEKFIVNFNTHGGEFMEAIECSVIDEMPTTTRSGYVLVGWYDNADYNGEAIVFPFAVTQKLTLHAKWEEKRPDLFTVSFVTNGGSSVAARQCTSIDTSPATTRQGNYRFAGWYDNANFSGEAVTFPYVVTEDTTLYAKWENTGYTLTFNTMGGSSVLEMSNQLAVNTANLPTPTKSNYVFAGWYLNEACTQAVGETYTLTQNTTFYAKWDSPTVITFTVHFFDGGNSLEVTVGDNTPISTTIDSTNSNDELRGKPFVTVNDGASISVTVPTRENAVFLGWTTTAVNNEKYVTFPMAVTKDTKLYAQWRINTTPNPDDSATLQTLLENNVYDTFVAGYGMLNQYSTGATANQTFTQYQYRPDKIIAFEYEYDEDAESTTVPGGTGAWVVAYLDFAFLRQDTTTYWMTYTQSPDGQYEFTYQGQQLWYKAENVTDIESAQYMVYLSKLDQLDSAKFYKYNGKWYATADYVDDAGHLLLGNASGNPELYSITYTELALTFNADGVITNIDARSNVIDSYSYNSGTAVTNFYYTHNIGIWKTDPAEVSDISESEFLREQTRPNGLYPELNPEDTNRNGVVTDGIAYTTAQLQTALNSMVDYTAYYTLAGRTFSGFLYSPVTLTVYGDYGAIKYDAYEPYTWGEFTSSAQDARNPWYFKYNENAFFTAVHTSNGYFIWCDQYSYKNNYDYNQYLLGLQSAIGANYKYPVALKYLNASNFTFDQEGGYFEFNGNAEQLTAIGKRLFGDMDVTYPDAGEVETYVSLRLYMNDGKIVKVLAASQLTLTSSESNEYFMKELVIKSYASTAVTLPSGVEAKFIAPGEAMVGGSVAGLQTAIDATRAANHKYTDKFVYDNDDELGGRGYYNSNSDNDVAGSDVYTYYNGIAKVDNLYMYFKNGVLYYQHTNDSVPKLLADYYGSDYEKRNSAVLWAYSVADLLEAEWFYQGKDGNYYGKADSMSKLSWVIGRYSGSELFLENEAYMSSYGFSDSYRWTVELDFVSVSVYGGKLEGIYYSGVIHVKGSSGEHTKPFSGYAKFSFDGTTLSLPQSDTVDATRPAVYQYVNGKYNFSVDYSGILHFDEVYGATSYRAYVYNLLNDTLVADFAVTDGFDLKTVTDLNAGADVKNYRIAIKAMGSVTPIDGVVYLDGAMSDLFEFELSTVPKHAKPTVTLNSKTATVTVTGDYPENTYYSYKVTRIDTTAQGGKTTVTVAQGNKKVSNVLDLNNLSVTLTPAKTHTIEIYIMGDSGVIRDSETVTVTYTVPKSDGTSFLGDLFGAIDYSKSFSVSLNAQDRYRYYYFDQIYDGIDLMNADSKWLSNNRLYTFNLSMYYEASLSKGKLDFYMADPSNGYNHLFDVTFRFNKINNTLVGQYVKTVDGAIVESKTLTTGLLFAGVAAFEDGFAELSGQIDSWPHLAYRYTDDITGNETQAAINELFILEEMLGVNLTYTAMQLNMGYSNGTLSTNTCSLALAADTDDGHSLLVSFCFSDFGKDLSNKVRD